MEEKNMTFRLHTREEILQILRRQRERQRELREEMQRRLPEFEKLFRQEKERHATFYEVADAI